MTTIILSSSLIVSGGLFLTYFVKYKKLRGKVTKTINSLEQSKSRKGYYKTNFTQTKAITNEVLKCEAIYMIKELERYTNDTSKIELEKIEIEGGGSNLDRNSVIKYATEQFVSLMKTSEITWLELEPDIREQRREKLNQLKEAFK